MTTVGLTDLGRLKGEICSDIDERGQWIVDFVDGVLRAPETGWREFGTSAALVDALHELGFETESGFARTGVRARLTGGRPGPTIAIIGELDSLLIADHPHADPETGAAHACGHNAQLGVLLGVAAGLAGHAEELAGDVVFLGVPAEECIELDFRVGLVERGEIEYITGKPELMRLGYFDDVDMALMVHAFADTPRALMSVSMNGAVVKQASFIGKSAHAGASPWDGINALSAANLALHAIDAQRETFRDEDGVRVLPVLATSQTVLSAIPDRVRVDVMVRARTMPALEDAAAKVDRALRGAALALGADVEIVSLPTYFPYEPNEALAAVVAENCEQVLGADQVDRTRRHVSACSDIGDVALVMPTVHVFSSSGNGAPTHSPDYWVTDYDQACIEPAKYLAMSVVDLLSGSAELAHQILRDEPAPMTLEEYLAERKRLSGEAKESSRVPATTDREVR